MTQEDRRAAAQLPQKSACSLDSRHLFFHLQIHSFFHSFVIKYAWEISSNEDRMESTYEREGSMLKRSRNWKCDYELSEKSRADFSKFLNYGANDEMWS